MRQNRTYLCGRLHAKIGAAEGATTYDARSVKHETLNESGQSNQQDLIGEMKTNRQHKATGASEFAMQASGSQRTPVIEQRCEWCLKRREQGTAICTAYRNEIALTTSAVMRPVMRLIASALHTLSVQRWVAMNCGEAELCLATVRMWQAAAQHRLG
jgi:hypothetical protein